MYEALANAFDEVGTLSGHQLSEKNAILLRNAFSKTANELTEALNIEQDAQHIESIQKLRESMLAGESLIEEIYYKQL